MNPLLIEILYSMTGIQCLTFDRESAGKMDFDVVIVSRTRCVSSVPWGQILGSRSDAEPGKVGTVTPDVATVVKNWAPPGPVPRRQGRHHPRHHRSSLVRRRAAAGQPGSTVGRSEQAAGFVRVSTCVRSPSRPPCGVGRVRVEVASIAV